MLSSVSFSGTVDSSEDKSVDEVSETVLFILEESDVMFSVLQPERNKVNNRINVVRMDIILTSFIYVHLKKSEGPHNAIPFIIKGAFDSVI